MKFYTPVTSEVLNPCDKNEILYPCDKDENQDRFLLGVDVMPICDRYTFKSLFNKKSIFILIFAFGTERIKKWENKQHEKSTKKNKQHEKSTKKYKKISNIIKKYKKNLVK